MSTSDGPRFQGGTAYLLAMAGAASRGRWVEALARLDLTPNQFKVVMSLDEVDSLGQRQLAQLIGVDPRNCVPIVDSLVEADLLSRRIDGADRRRRVLCLTDQGRQLARELKAVNAEIETKLLSPLSPEQQSALHHMLTAIYQAAQAEA